MSDFDPQRYWDDRLRQDFSLGGVGWLGMGEEFNRWLYRVRRDVFLRQVRPWLPDSREISVLDVGSGTGFYLERWRELGVRDISGADISEFAVGELRHRFPDITVVQADISEPDAMAPFGDRRFDVVSAMDVLFHIVDDEAYRRGIDNLVGLLKPDGLLVLTDMFLQVPPQRSMHHAFRSGAEIESRLRSSGAVPVSAHPSFILLHVPLNARGRWHHLWWDLVVRLARYGPRAANLVGGATYCLETVMLRLFPNYKPSTRLTIWRRVEPPAQTP